MSTRRSELPNAIEHEKKLLSAMMLVGGKIVPDVAAQITADEFYRPEHRAIYQAIISAYNRTSEPISDLLVWDEIVRAKTRVEKSYLFSLSELEYSTARANSYIQRIKETARLREIVDATDIALEGIDNGKTAAEIRAGLDNLLYKDNGGEPTDLILSGKITANVLERAIKLSETKELTGVPTGFEDLNKLTNGLQKSDLIFLAARPSMGKTALALNIAHNAAKKKKKVAVFSLEMSGSQIGARLLSAESNVPVSKITSGRYNQTELAALQHAQFKIAELPLYIDETSQLTPALLRAKTQKFKHEQGLDLVVVDYIQLMVGNQPNPNRVQEVSEISRSLKALAKSLDVPVLVLSQLSRQVEQRADKRPLLSDLRESGSLEQDADIVMFLYRDEYYNRDESDCPDIAELIIAKNRNGATGDIRLHFSKDIVRFGDLTRIEY